MLDIKHSSHNKKNMKSYAIGCLKSYLFVAVVLKSLAENKHKDVKLDLDFFI